MGELLLLLLLLLLTSSSWRYTEGGRGREALDVVTGEVSEGVDRGSRAGRLQKFLSPYGGLGLEVSCWHRGRRHWVLYGSREGYGARW